MRVEGDDKVERSTLAVDCTEADFRTFETSAYAALISNISERDRAEDVEQLDDILRNFINETNKYEGRFGKNPDEGKILAVKKLMPESLLNCRLRGTTLPHEELLIALENIITDKVRRVRENI